MARAEANRRNLLGGHGQCRTVEVNPGTLYKPGFTAAARGYFTVAAEQRWR